MSKSKKSLQIQKTYEALFALEDIREIFRQSLPVDELKERGIIGEFAGATRTWKLNTYGLTWEQIKYTADSFLDIANKQGLSVS